MDGRAQKTHCPNCGVPFFDNRALIGNSVQVVLGISASTGGEADSTKSDLLGRLCLRCGNVEVFADPKPFRRLGGPAMSQFEQEERSGR